MRFALIVILSMTACLPVASPSEPDTSTADQADEQLPPATPTCASLGCPYAPSGNPSIWAPCSGNYCWCGHPAQACVVNQVDTCPHC
jgi:hypothetical protein